jgi:hypothetical protein
MIVFAWSAFGLAANLLLGALVWQACDDEPRSYYRWYCEAPRELAWLLQPLVLTCWPFAVYARLRGLKPGRLP